MFFAILGHFIDIYTYYLVVGPRCISTTKTWKWTNALLLRPHYRDSVTPVQINSTSGEITPGFPSKKANTNEKYPRAVVFLLQNIILFFLISSFYSSRGCVVQTETAWLVESQMVMQATPQTRTSFFSPLALCCPSAKVTVLPRVCVY